MIPFLRQIAEIYYKEQGANISDTCFVFPSRRAGKFFIEHLKNISNETLLAPECLTISEFFDTLAPEYEKEEKVGLLFHLFDSYKTVTGFAESFNEFIGIGEIILKDFNDLDNYLVNAKYIFSDIEELKRYEQENILTEEQVECIQKFLGLFAGDCSEYKQKTYQLWCKMLEIYEHFKNKLLSEKICYDGMLHRMVVENEIPEHLLPTQVVFVGFNALDGATKALFDILKRKEIADFYWDYDFKYANISEDKANKAHYFTKTNLENYKSKYILEAESYPETTIHTIGCSSNIGQTKYTNKLLKELLNIKSEEEEATNKTEEVATETATEVTTEEVKEDEKAIKTALILSDESLLIPMIYALPKNNSVNITMGYPIKYTSTYYFIDLFLSLHKNFKQDKGFNQANTKEILSHPFIASLCKAEIEKLDKFIFNNSYIPEKELESDNELMKLIFTSCDYKELLSKLLLVIEFLADTKQTELDNECLNQAYIATNKTITLLERYPNISIDANTIYRIMTSVLKMVNLSFIGEPLSGLQMMGMLETRCLDFDNIIITSFNEGIFPKSDIGNSLIPYSIRKPYGLPTTDHQDAIFSYNFYRLIKRASNVWLIYDTRNNNDNSTGEVSRFVKQLEFLYNVKIDKKQVTHTPEICKSEDIVIEKSEKDKKDIEKYFHDIGLTPSALNEYIKCPLKFYYTYIKGIREQSEVATTLDAAQLGRVFHTVMELIYTPFKDKVVTTHDLSQYTKKKIEELTYKAVVFTLYDLKKIEDVEKISYQITGENKILFEIIVEMVINMLECDKERTPFIHKSCENKYYGYHTTVSRNKVLLKGFIDKVDETKDAVHLIDYKTTKLIDNTEATRVDSKELKDFFYAPNDKKYVKEILQMCFYNILYKTKTNKNIETYLFLARMSFDHKNFLDNTQVKLPDDWETIFKEELDKVIDNLMNKDEKIYQTSNHKNCEYCYFAPMCRREKGD